MALKTILVGLGRIGWNFHLPAIISYPDKFQLVGTVDPLEERLKEATDKFGCRGYKNFEIALQKENPDLVIIATPTHFHYSQILTAFDYGCDVFCDKPISQTLEEFQNIFCRMKKLSRKLMTYQPHRIRPETVTLKTILERNIIGPLFMIKREISNYQRRNDWQAFLKNGGGMLNNYGVHFIDQFLYFAKSKISTSSCWTRKICSLGDAEDVVKLILETENSLIFDLEINMASAESFNQWRVFGKHGTAVLDESNGLWKVKYYHPEHLSKLDIQKGFAADKREYANGELIYWKDEYFSVKDDNRCKFDFYTKCYEYFAEDKEPFVPIEETMEVMRIISECRKKSQLQITDIINMENGQEELVPG